MIKPSHAHWILAKHVLRYLHQTINIGLRYTTGYTNVDWDGNYFDRNSTSKCFFSFRSSVISWMRRKKKYDALSTLLLAWIVMRKFH